MTNAPSTAVAEIVTFELNPGVTDDAFLALMRPSEGFTSYAPGFVSRKLSKGADGAWTDYVVWGSMEAAKDAARCRCAPSTATWRRCSSAASPSRGSGAWAT